MHDFRFRIVPKEEGTGVPISVAGKTMVNIQSALLHIGEYQVANELRLQKAVPETLLTKFILTIGRSEGYSISSAVFNEDEFSGNLLDLTAEILEATLDTLEKGTSDEWYLENFPDSKYRSNILRDLLTLSNDLGDYILLYGASHDEKQFLGVNSYNLEKFIEGDLRTIPGTIEGVITKISDTSFSLNIGKEKVLLVFNGTLTSNEAEQYCDVGPCIVTGMITYSDNGEITRIDSISDIDEFPEIVFRRVITEDRDMLLRNAVTAYIGFDTETGMWTLKSDLLGISISKDNWDDAVIEFHNYFVFLWEIYAEETKDELSAEEIEIREYLLSLIPEKA